MPSRNSPRTPALAGSVAGHSRSAVLLVFFIWCDLIGDRLVAQSYAFNGRSGGRSNFFLMPALAGSV
jgi:hypothetical protein